MSLHLITQELRNLAGTINVSEQHFNQLIGIAEAIVTSPLNMGLIHVGALVAGVRVPAEKAGIKLDCVVERGSGIGVVVQRTNEQIGHEGFAFLSQKSGTRVAVSSPVLHIRKTDECPVHWLELYANQLALFRFVMLRLSRRNSVVQGFSIEQSLRYAPTAQLLFHDGIEGFHPILDVDGLSDEHFRALLDILRTKYRKDSSGTEPVEYAVFARRGDGNLLKAHVYILHWWFNWREYKRLVEDIKQKVASSALQNSAKSAISGVLDPLDHGRLRVFGLKTGQQVYTQSEVLSKEVYEAFHWFSDEFSTPEAVTRIGENTTTSADASPDEMLTYCKRSLQQFWPFLRTSSKPGCTTLESVLMPSYEIPRTRDWEPPIYTPLQCIANGTVPPEKGNVVEVAAKLRRMFQDCFTVLVIGTVCDKLNDFVGEAAEIIGKNIAFVNNAQNVQMFSQVPSEGGGYINRLSPPVSVTAAFAAKGPLKNAKVSFPSSRISESDANLYLREFHTLLSLGIKKDGNFITATLDIVLFMQTMACRATINTLNDVPYNRDHWSLVEELIYHTPDDWKTHWPARWDALYRLEEETMPHKAPDNSFVPGRDFSNVSCYGGHFPVLQRMCDILNVHTFGQCESDAVVCFWSMLAVKLRFPAGDPLGITGNFDNSFMAPAIAALFIGTQGCGKSFLKHLICSLFGHHNVSTPVKTDENFNYWVNALWAVWEDPKVISDTELKQTVGIKVATVNRKYQAPVQTRIHVNLVYNVNTTAELDYRCGPDDRRLVVFRSQGARISKDDSTFLYGLLGNLSFLGWLHKSLCYGFKEDQSENSLTPLVSGLSLLSGVARQIVENINYEIGLGAGIFDRWSSMPAPFTAGKLHLQTTGGLDPSYSFILKMLMQGVNISAGFEGLFSEAVLLEYDALFDERTDRRWCRYLPATDLKKISDICCVKGRNLMDAIRVAFLPPGLKSVTRAELLILLERKAIQDDDAFLVDSGTALFIPVLKRCRERYVRNQGLTKFPVCSQDAPPFELPVVPYPEQDEGEIPCTALTGRHKRGDAEQFSLWNVTLPHVLMGSASLLKCLAPAVLSGDDAAKYVNFQGERSKSLLAHMSHRSKQLRRAASDFDERSPTPSPVHQTNFPPGDDGASFTCSPDLSWSPSPTSFLDEPDDTASRSSPCSMCQSYSACDCSGVSSHPPRTNKRVRR